MTVDDRVGNARAPHLVLRWGGTSVLRAPLSTTGELGRDYGASTTRRKVSAAVPEATTGRPRVASQTKQNKTKHHGPCKVCMNESNLSLLCLCDTPREGFSKASVSLFKPFSQGLCKASARDPSFCSKILVKGYAREGFNERSSSSLTQSDTVPKTNRYAPPPP